MDALKLRTRIRQYVRDTASKRFTDSDLNLYVEEAIDRLRSYPIFTDMPYLSDDDDELIYLPENYHYIVALYAASRCFSVDNDFYQEEQKRNEFESIFADLISKIEGGEVTINDITGNAVVPNYVTDTVQDVYFNTSGTSDETGIEGE